MLYPLKYNLQEYASEKSSHNKFDSKQHKVHNVYIYGSRTENIANPNSNPHYKLCFQSYIST